MSGKTGDVSFSALANVLPSVQKGLEKKAYEQKKTMFIPKTTTSKTLNKTKSEEVTNQQVLINADFPGVSHALEIEKALNNLVNNASQYVNRTNKD